MTMPQHTTLLCIVGFQPSAIVSALDTWNVYYGRLPDEIVLLQTPPVEGGGVSQRIIAAFPGDRDRFRPLPIAKHLVASDNRPSVGEQVTRVADTVRQKGADLVFLADSGAKFLVLDAALRLPPQTRLVSCDDYWWRVYDPMRDDVMVSHPVSDIGIRRLLDLYEIQIEAGSPSRRIPGATAPHAEVLTRVTFSAARSVPVFHAAFERHGKLHLLLMLKGPTAGGKTRKGAIEQLRECAEAVTALGWLQPRVTICSDDPYVPTQASDLGFPCIGRRAIQRWVDAARPTSPGHEAAESINEPLPTPVRSGGGNGGPLVTWMSRDPSSTLVALYTHRPEHAILLYDEHTPAVRRALTRLLSQPDLPVGVVTPLPAGFYGRTDAVTFQQASGRDFVVNASPATKAQALQTLVLARQVWAAGQAVASAPLTNRVWTLVQKAKVARPLNPSSTEELPLCAPPIRVQARVCGGELSPLSTGVDFPGRLSDDERRFLVELGRAASELVAGAAELGRGIPGLVPLKTAGRISVTEGSGLVSVDIGRRVVLTGRVPVHRGDWFDLVVAACCHQAGADEVVVGLKWLWEPKIQQRLKQRGRRGPLDKRDADVIARIGTRFYVFECKAGTGTSLANQKRQAVGVAKALGRFAIPVAARPLVGHQEEMAGSGAVTVDLSTLTDPDRLARFFRDAAARRATMAED